MKISFGLKLTGAASLMLLAAACATNAEGPDVVATAPDTSDAADRGPVPGSQADLEQNAGHRVFFDYDQYAVNGRARATLARQAEWLKKHPSTKILVAGNCDERGTREYNLALGARRAQAARAFLDQQRRRRQPDFNCFLR